MCIGETGKRSLRNLGQGGRGPTAAKSFQHQRCSASASTWRPGLLLWTSLPSLPVTVTVVGLGMSVPNSNSIPPGPGNEVRCWAVLCQPCSKITIGAVVISSQRPGLGRVCLCQRVPCIRRHKPRLPSESCTLRSALWALVCQSRLSGGCHIQPPWKPWPCLPRAVGALSLFYF